MVLWQNRDVLPSTWLEGRLWLKAPTGRDHTEVDGEPDPHLQPGTGSWDWGTGLAAGHRLSWGSLYASLYYRENNEGSIDYEYGDAFFANAAWCPECKEELPGLERAARDCGGAVRVAPVNVGEPVEVARRFLEQQGTTLPLLRDPEGRVWRELARGLPANLIWTRLERRVEVGPHVFEDWGRLLRELGCRSMEGR